MDPDTLKKVPDSDPHPWLKGPDTRFIYAEEQRSIHILTKYLVGALGCMEPGFTIGSDPSTNYFKVPSVQEVVTHFI